MYEQHWPLFCQNDFSVVQLVCYWSVRSLCIIFAAKSLAERALEFSVGDNTCALWDQSIERATAVHYCDCLIVALLGRMIVFSCSVKALVFKSPHCWLQLREAERRDLESDCV